MLLKLDPKNGTSVRDYFYFDMDLSFIFPPQPKESQTL